MAYPMNVPCVCPVNVPGAVIAWPLALKTPDTPYVCVCVVVSMHQTVSPVLCAHARVCAPLQV